MENVGGITSTTVAHWRIMSQPATLDDFFLTNDLTETLKNIHNNKNNKNNNYKRGVSRVTLGVVLNSDKKPPPSNATLFRMLFEAINEKTSKPFKSSQKLKQPSLPQFSDQNQNQNQGQNQNQHRLPSAHRRKYSC